MCSVIIRPELCVIVLHRNHQQISICYQYLECFRSFTYLSNMHIYCTVCVFVGALQ